MSARSYSHVWVIGGTGMLREATVELSHAASKLTVVARSQGSVDSVDSRIGGECVVHAVVADWSDPDAFVARLEGHLEDAGQPSLVVAWVHQNELGCRLASMLAGAEVDCDFFLLRGSSAAAPPLEPGADVPEFGATVRFHQIILGFQVEESGSRWLRHDEIVGGTLRAIERGADVSVIGRVRPWADRP